MRFLKTKTIGVTLLAAVIGAIAIRLLVGRYAHDEFGEKHFFIKHRPIWKWNFHSPIGQGDLKFENLTNKDQKEQRLFDEFILKQGMSK